MSLRRSSFDDVPEFLALVLHMPNPHRSIDGRGEELCPILGVPAAGVEHAHVTFGLGHVD